MACLSILRRRAALFSVTLTLALPALLTSCGPANLPRLPTPPVTTDDAGSGADTPRAVNGRNFITRSQGGLSDGRGPFYFQGANQYYLFFKNRQMVDDVFAAAQALQLNTLRTWAFCNGEKHDGLCLQPAAGVYDEASFKNLDYVVKKAGEQHVRLVLTLSNNWDDFGGVSQYLKWVDPKLTHDDFFRKKAPQALYKNYVEHVLNRVNSYTGVAYKDDPSILMWELMNEPRADDKPALYGWIDEMAGFIKSIDRHHLVSTGSEGGYISDFVATHASPNIDVASMHLYPENWGISVDAATTMLRDQIIMAREQLHKPMFLGEFGMLDKTKRDAVYQQWYDVMDQEDISGSLIWLLSGTQFGEPQTAGKRYPDYDGFTIYYPESRGTVPIIQAYSQKVQAKLRNPAITLITPMAATALSGTVRVEAHISAINSVAAAGFQVDGGAWTSLQLVTTKRSGISMAGHRAAAGSAPSSSSSSPSQQRSPLKPSPGPDPAALADPAPVDTYQGSFDSTQLSDGSHVLTLAARDGQNGETVHQYQVIIRNHPGQATHVTSAPLGGVGPDFAEIYAADDAAKAYFLIARYDGDKPYRSDNYLYVDIDNDPNTGENGFDHRFNLRSIGTDVRGFDDVIEWYYWSGKYWAYGGYWQAAGQPGNLQASHTPQTLPSGLTVAAGGLLEFALPKFPPEGQAAGTSGMRFWLDGAHHSIGSGNAPILHPYSNDQTITIDGRITTPEEWAFSRD